MLVVDDDSNIRELIGELLTSEGYAVELADDGRQALDILRATPRRMVVLLDVMMPVVDGVQTLEAVAADEELARRHAFLIMTASSVNDHKGLLKLVHEFNAPVLTKPFSIEALLRTLNVVAARLRNS
ncbi:MAG TPA: response regulator [Ktedonobacterales bacterium]